MNAASRMLLVSALLTGILLCAGEVAGQSVQGTNRFVRQLDAVSWSLNTRADYLSETLRFSMDNRLSSRLFLFNDQAQNIQDEQDHLLQFQYALKPAFRHQHPGRQLPVHQHQPPAGPCPDRVLPATPMNRSR